MFKLSPRLQRIFDHLLPGKPLWDFCCDHGYLGIHAYKSGDFPEIHFVDQAPHLLSALEHKFQLYGHQSPSTTKVFFHPIPGEKVELPVHGSVVIAGVGADTIEDILRGLLRISGNLKADRIILGPQKNEEHLLRSLMQHEDFKRYYELLGDDQIVERGRLRKLLIFGLIKKNL